MVNPGIVDLTLSQVHGLINTRFVVSRIWHDGNVSIPGPEDKLHAGDRVLTVINEEDLTKPDGALWREGRYRLESPQH